MIKVAIIGAGRGGTSLMEILHHDPFVKVIGIADVEQDAPGIKLAKSLNIPVISRYIQFLNPRKTDIIIDVTGNPAVESDLFKNCPKGVSVIGGSVAKFMWQLIDQQIRSKADIERHMLEYQSLYHLYMKETRHAIVEERARIAMEMHDGLIQTLVGLNFKMDLGKDQMTLDPQRGMQTLKETQSILKSAIDEAREVIFNLKPLQGEEIELAASLKHHLKVFGKQNKVITELKVQGDENKVLARSKIFLFRIIQEALSNIQKHARANKVTVRMRIAKTFYQATILDNGVGFNPREISKDPGRWAAFGLKGIQQRARLLGGTAQISSKIRQGTTITVRVPLPEKELEVIETGSP